MVTAQFLLEGAVYALQHSGTLMRDAVTLYDQSSYPSAVVLAMFGREELGKFIILRGYFEEVTAGETVSLNRIKQKCSDHIKKQNRAILSIVLRGSSGLVRGSSPPGSRAFEKAEAKVKKMAARKMSEIPHQRHKLRLSSLYVEPSEDGLGWLRPQQQDKEEALNEIMEAVNDYSSAYDHLVRGNDDPNVMLTAFQAWADRPQLLEPVWPSLPI